MAKEIVVAMATFPPRREGLLKVVNQILPQCDRLCLYLNGYTEVPAELPVSDKLEIILAGPNCEAPDKGSQGKLHWLDKYNDCYYLTIDDDIIYPHDYVKYMVSRLEHYQGKAIVGLHGCFVRFSVVPGRGPRISRQLFPYNKACNRDACMHGVGMGLAACVPSTIGLTSAVVSGDIHSGDDEDIAIWAQRNRIPVIKLATRKDWVRADAKVWVIDPLHRRPGYLKASADKLMQIKRWLTFPTPQSLLTSLPGIPTQPPLTELPGAPAPSRNKPPLPPIQRLRRPAPGIPDHVLTACPKFVRQSKSQSQPNDVDIKFKAAAPIVIAMATFPPRKEGMLRVVNDLLPQCDKFCLYMNGYTEIPDELPESAKLEIILAGPGCEAPDKSTQGKQHWLDKYQHSYYLTVDDDIFYASDYAERMVKAIDRYNGKAIITAHGTSFKLTDDGRIPEDKSVRECKTCITYPMTCKVDTQVHYCGCGVSGCYPAAIGMTCAITHGELHSGDDADYALFTQRNEIPIIRLASEPNWLRANAAIWPIQAHHRNVDHQLLQDTKIRGLEKPWRLFPVEIAAPVRSPYTPPAPLITVSITTFNTPRGMLRKAVDSMLNQTERRLVVVVVNDGGSTVCWDELRDIIDPRLQRIDMPTNQGTYACHAEVLRRCTTEWWSPVDADDYCVPERFATVLAASADADVVLGGYTNIDKAGNHSVQLPLPTPRAVSRHIRWSTTWAGGLWRTTWLRRAGGINGSYRVGFDAGLQTLAVRFGRLRIVDDPGYMRVMHPASLTMTSATGMRSAFRQRVKDSLDHLFDTALTVPTLEEAGDIMRQETFI